jgi:hypothetical protein
VNDPPVNLWIVQNVFANGITGDYGLIGQRALDVYMPDPPTPNDRYFGNTIH